MTEAGAGWAALVMMGVVMVTGVGEKAAVMKGSSAVVVTQVGC